MEWVKLTLPQVVIVMLVFLVSRKFHPGFGITGSGFDNKPCKSVEDQYHVGDCVAAKKIACRRGWEW